jgi:hypothetical protein
VNGAGPGAPDLLPAYLFAVCEGRRCVPIEELEAEWLSEAEAVAALALLAARLRARGGVGRVVLVDGRTGAVVATRRVWP